MKNNSHHTIVLIKFWFSHEIIKLDMIRDCPQILLLILSKFIGRSGLMNFYSPWNHKKTYDFMISARRAVDQFAQTTLVSDVEFGDSRWSISQKMVEKMAFPFFKTFLWQIFSNIIEDYSTELTGFFRRTISFPANLT